MKLNFRLLLGCLAICQPSLAQAQPIIPDGTTTIADDAFYGRTDLTNVVIPDSVTNIGGWAFYACTNLTRITVGKGIATIGESAFACMAPHDFLPFVYPLPVLVNVCFTGNAPTNVSAHTFDADINVGIGGDYASCNVTVYYLSGTTGWGTTLAGRPTICLGTRISDLHPYPNYCGFTIHGASNATVVVETCTNMAHPVWRTVGYSMAPRLTNLTLTSTQTVFWDDFRDLPNCIPATRFYRVRQQW